MANKANLKVYAKKIYLLGTAELGPVNVPIRAVTASHVQSVFGDRGSLVDAYKVIKASDKDCDVYLVKVAGTHSELYLNINQSFGEILEEGLYFKSKHANEKYNGIKIMLDQDSLYIIYDDLVNGEYILEYKYSEHLTIHELVEAINEDSRRLRSDVYCYANCSADTISYGALDTVNPAVSKLSGGNSGLFYNKNMIYNCLTDTYSMLEGVDVDIIIPLNVNYDDTYCEKESSKEFYDLNREYLTLMKGRKYLSYYEQLLQFCMSQMRFGHLTHGLMGLSPTGDPFINEAEYLKKLKHFRETNEVSSKRRKYKHLISVCAGDLYTLHGTRVYNGFVAYAVVMSNVSIAENTTNKKLPVSITLFNNFCSDTLVKLAKTGFTSFRYSPLTKTVVVSNGITTSDDEDLKYLCNIRMMQLAMSRVRVLLQSFVGRNIQKLIQTKELETSLISLLEELASMNIIKGFSVNEVINPITGHIFLDLGFKTIYMVEEVRAYSGIAAIK